MSGFIASLKTMFGAKPPVRDPQKWSPEAKEMHEFKRTSEEVKKRIKALKEEKDLPRGKKWKVWRWTSIAVVNLMFVVSYWLDVQLVEGALTASRFVGFHMADLNSALQVMLAHKAILINLIIGTVTVFILWWLLGGRTFCSWVCPYHLLSEWAEMIHLKLRKTKLVRDNTLHRGTRTVLYIIFALLAVVTGYTVFEAISPVGIVSRALIYGPGLALVWVAGLLIVEIFFSRRFWCRYICPIGMTYGIVGSIAPVRIKYDMKDCLHEGDCRKVCLVPHVLEPTKMGYANHITEIVGADCTRCGMCVDICPTNSLNFDIMGAKKLL